MEQWWLTLILTAWTISNNINYYCHLRPYIQRPAKMLKHALLFNAISIGGTMAYLFGLTLVIQTNNTERLLSPTYPVLVAVFHNTLGSLGPMWRIKWGRTGAALVAAEAFLIFSLWWGEIYGANWARMGLFLFALIGKGVDLMSCQ